MRFYFCGGLDCPDWVLAQIGFASKLTSLKFKILLKSVIACLMNHGLIHDKALDKLTSAGKFDIQDLQACFSAVSFILRSACSHNVSIGVLNDELQQLGLPKEHAQTICKSYANEFQNLHETLCQTSINLNRISSIECESLDIRHDDVTKIIKIDIRLRPAIDSDEPLEPTHSILASAEKIAILLNDLTKLSEEISKA